MCRSRTVQVPCARIHATPSSAPVNFGYPWWLSYGHVPLLASTLLLLLLGYWRKWSKWPMLALGLFALWSFSAFLVMHFLIDINARGALPTPQFLSSGEGRVLDIGAGTGRSSIMVLEARPHATLVALDLFGDSFEQHFGPGDRPQDRLLRNLQAAGVAQRASIVSADMRKLPFEPSAFDAIVSAYAMDHLNRQGIGESLAEADRVLKPGGDFLLMLVAREPWVEFALGPVIIHGGMRNSAWWSASLQEAGFKIVEQGTRPATLYFLARKTGPT
jgi:ubiquinone/menaquinone biosynthesis C-methylase UbiE